jgi:hypothetical protein
MNQLRVSSAHELCKLEAALVSSATLPGHCDVPGLGAQTNYASYGLYSATYSSLSVLFRLEKDFIRAGSQQAESHIDVRNIFVISYLGPSEFAAHWRCLNGILSVVREYSLDRCQIRRYFV